MTLGEKIEIVNLFEYEELAKNSLPKLAYDYYVSGAADEITLKENHAAYERIFISPHMLVDVSKRNLATTVLGQKISTPILIAPMAFQKMAHKDGEIATAKAAANCGTIMVMSTLATCSLEEIMHETKGPAWFQLYIYSDRSVTESLVRRAEAAGCSAIVITVDSPLLGKRERDVRNSFSLPQGLSCKNFDSMELNKLPDCDYSSGLAEYLKALYDTSFNWKDLQWLVSITKLPVLVKGILRADDAKLAVDCGVKGIIVSNHGGRQLDTVPATIDVLPEIAQAVGAKTEILVDGGIRRGTDVLKAIALGAKAVLVGRPVLWGLAVAGQEGVENVLQILKDELDLALALCGCPDIKDLSPDLIQDRSNSRANHK